MTVPVEDWQSWRVDPRGLAPLVDNSGDSVERAYAKLDTQELGSIMHGQASILQALRFSPAVIVSARHPAISGMGKAWICRVNHKPSRHPLSAPFPNNRSCDAFRIRAVDADLTKPIRERELIAYDRDLPPSYRRSTVTALEQFVYGIEPDSAAPAPGTIARFSLQGSDSEEFDGFVVASTTIWRQGHRLADANPLLVCQLVDYTPGDEKLQARVVLGTNSNTAPATYASLPVTIDITLTRSIARTYVTAIVGNAAGYLDSIRSEILALLASSL